MNTLLNKTKTLSINEKILLLRKRITESNQKISEIKINLSKNNDTN